MCYILLPPPPILVRWRQLWNTSSRRAGYKLSHHFQAQVALSGDTIKQTQRKSHRNKRMFQKRFLCIFSPPLSIFSFTLTFFIFVYHKRWSKIERDIWKETITFHLSIFKSLCPPFIALSNSVSLQLCSTLFTFDGFPFKVSRHDIFWWETPSKNSVHADLF